MLGIYGHETDAIISSHRDRIVEVTSRAWLPQEILGCGRYGCVYSTLDPNVVCKVSTDPTEYMFIDLAMRLGEWPEGIVRYYQILELPIKHEHGDAFVVWREAAFDVGGVLTTHRDTSDSERHQIKNLHFNLIVLLFATNSIKSVLLGSSNTIQMVKSVNRRTNYIKYLRKLFPNNPDIDPYEVEELIEAITNPLEELSFSLQMAKFIIDRMRKDSLSYHIAEALDFYMRRGITFADIHSDNIGKVHREDLGTIVVITDPGHAVLLSDGQVL